MQDGIDDGQRDDDRSLEHPRDAYLSGVAVIVGAEVKSILDNASG